MSEQFDNITKVRALCLLACARQLNKHLNTQDLPDEEAQKVANTLQHQFTNIVTEHLNQDELVTCSARFLAREIDNEIHRMMRMVAEVSDDNITRKELLMGGIKHVCSEVLGTPVEL